MFFKITVVTLCCFVADGREHFGNTSTNAYNAEELLSKTIFGNATQPRGYIKFEDDQNLNHLSFDDQTSNASPVKFDINQESNIPGEIADNRFNNPTVNGFQANNGKKKRRRRKSKKQFQAHPGVVNPAYLGPNGQKYGEIPGPIQSLRPFSGPGQDFGPIGPYYSSEFNEQFDRPSRRPQPSIATDALAAVTGALSSIAHNDDFQCVPRLLCEAAAGGALGGSSLLESVSGLQQLLTLLSAYNGVSSNPLFVFGRAAFLGMSSKSNPGSCRYAYPLCPTDPEELIHYLNNHKGGFFKFFNAPQQDQQNLEQFYNHLSQNYGLYQPNAGQSPDFYGLSNAGIYQNSGTQDHLYPNGYGYQQNYGFAYPYNQNYNNGNGIRFKNDKILNDYESKDQHNAHDNKIEKRIQNKPASVLNDNFVLSNTKWLFPGEDDYDTSEHGSGVQYVNYDNFGLKDKRKRKSLKFPDSASNYNNEQEYSNEPVNFFTTQTITTPKGISFPDSQSNQYNVESYYSPVYFNDMNYLNNANKRMSEIFRGDVRNNNNYNDNYQEEPGVRTVYVVRGNGDPNKPEIVKLRPGETL